MTEQAASGSTALVDDDPGSMGETPIATAPIGATPGLCAANATSDATPSGETTSGTTTTVTASFNSAEPTEPTEPSPAVSDVKKNSDAAIEEKKKPKPRVLRERQQGIYTIQDLEAANMLVEWHKGLRASAPYMLRLIKTYWSLSPTYSSALVIASLLKAVLPSFQLWIRKEFLDQVQLAAERKPVLPGKLLALLLLRLLEQGMKQGLELTT
jgi:hypothetical protein